MKRAVIIGSGNVAEALAFALPECGFEVVQVYARNAGRGVLLAAVAGCGWSCAPEDIAGADIYIVSVSDRAITEVLSPLRLPDDAVVVHTSGAQPLDAIPARFRRRGVIYPLQTFTSGRRVDFSSVPLFVEGSDDDTLERVKEAASQLSSRIFEADSRRRAQLHLSGVLACNFVNAMYGAAADAVRAAGYPFDVLEPLIAETAAKAVGSGNPRAVQTGPAVRGDRTTVERHLQLIEDSRLAEIYELLSEYIYERKL